MRLAYAAIALITLTGTSALAQTYVPGYTRNDGTYVAPHYRSAPDTSRFNNYSTQGNINPYTGSQGTVNPYTYTPPPTYRAPAPYSNPYAPRRY